MPSDKRLKRNRAAASLSQTTGPDRASPTILVTNDDGVMAPGLLALKIAFEQVARVIVIAPDRNWSAAGHTKTLHRPLAVRQVALADGTPAFATDGAPSDCVALASLGFISEPVDLVVSGVNHGPNVGDDVTYSGTVAAAMEGSISGIPSIAVSLDDYDSAAPHFAEAAAFARELAQRALERRIASDVILNVNVPNRPNAARLPVQITRLGKRIYRDVLEERADPTNGTLFWIGGERPTGEPTEGTDIRALSDGCISVTPIHLDLTNHRLLKELQTWGL